MSKRQSSKRSRMAVIEARIAAAIQAELAADCARNFSRAPGNNRANFPATPTTMSSRRCVTLGWPCRIQTFPHRSIRSRWLRLQHLSTLTYCPVDGGDARPLLEPGELAALGVRAGTLDDEELREMRNHVAYGHRYLSQIPWGSSLSGVPSIAAGHHERLDGSGYPKALRAADISD